MKLEQFYTTFGGTMNHAEKLCLEQVLFPILGENGLDFLQPQTSFLDSDGKMKWGLYDMAGNVFEWTDSWYDSSRSDRVIRGGSWGYYAGDCRSAIRDSSTPGDRGNFVGFRLVFVP